MPIPSKPVKLTEIRWNLSSLADISAEIPKPYTCRLAGEQEKDEALRVIRASYDLDPEWSGCDKYIEETVLPGVNKAFAGGGETLFALHGNRVIGASTYRTELGSEEVHLVSGPCVLIEYRNRGIGAGLLSATLQALREHGVTEATGLTRPNSPAAKFLCPKFGGQPSGKSQPPPAPEQEAAA